MAASRYLWSGGWCGSGRGSRADDNSRAGGWRCECNANRTAGVGDGLYSAWADGAYLRQRAVQQVDREIGTGVGADTDVEQQGGHFRAAAQDNLPAIVHFHRRAAGILCGDGGAR